MTSYPQGTPAYEPHTSQNVQPAATPEQERKLASLVNLTWTTAGIFAVLQLLTLFTADIAYQASLDALESLGADASAGTTLALPEGDGPSYGGTIAGLVIGLALFALVAILLKKRKNGGRITGFIFASLGIIGAAFTALSVLIYPQPWMLIMLLVTLAWLVCSILWIVKAANRDVTAALAQR